MRIEMKPAGKKTNWVKGIVDGGKYEFQAMLFDEGSEHGIYEGRVSKLLIQNEDGKTTTEYDRGWEVYPHTEEQSDVFEEVLDFLEDSPKKV